MGGVLFADLAAALREAGCSAPTLVLDRDALEHNLAVLQRRAVPPVRLVVKSLPSPALIDHCMDALATRRLMAFHRPFLEQLLARYDDVDILMGKPLPIAAVEQVVQRCPRDRLCQVQWLVDGARRLAELRDLARRRALRLRVNLEIDVGMHRGGVDTPGDLAALEREVLAAPEHLEFSGLMGYDAHAAKAPPLAGGVARAVERSQQRYRDFLAVLQTERAALTLNGAGSPTHTYHDLQSPVNEVSVGSVLVKPADFDLPGLADYRPAVWIATLVLKHRTGVTLPFLERISHSLSRLRPLRRDTLFIYGGRWLAEPAWPVGMNASALYGLSSNQQMMTVPADTGIGVDDWVFFRPVQSEAVMLQFGDIRVVSGGRVIDRWPTLRND